MNEPERPYSPVSWILYYVYESVHLHESLSLLRYMLRLLNPFFWLQISIKFSDRFQAILSKLNCLGFRDKKEALFSFVLLFWGFLGGLVWFYYYYYLMFVIIMYWDVCRAPVH